MSIVKMGFYGLSISDQIERTRHIVTMMTGNATYPTPNPTLMIMSGAATTLEVAYNEARNRDKIKIATMNDRRKDLLKLVVQLSGYVQEASAGDAAAILSSGFFVREQGSPKPTTAGDVPNFRLADGELSGTIGGKWDKAPFAVNYVMQVADTIEFKNTLTFGITTRTHKELGGLTPGTTVWVRVIALGKEKPGNPCAPISWLVR